MKATVDRKLLADATKAVAKFLPRMSSIAALGHLLVQAHSGIVAVTAFDMEAGRRVEVEASVKTEGDLLVPPSLTQIVASGMGDEVELSATDTNLTVKIGQATNRLRLGNRDDYPDAEPTITDGVTLPIESWHKVQAVARIASTDRAGNAQRPYMLGVHFDGNHVAATDTYKLAAAHVTSEADHPAVTVPARAILALDATVTALQVGDRTVKATTDDGAWWARLIEGAYPKWRQFVEAGDTAVKLSLPAERLAGVVARAHHITEDHVPLHLTIEGDDVRAHAVRTDVGEFDEAFAADVEWADDAEDHTLTVAFNPGFLRQIVDPGEHVEVSIVDGVRAATFMGDQWFHGVLMPVRTNK